MKRSNGGESSTRNRVGRRLEALRQAAASRRRLARRQACYRRIVESTHVGIWLVDREARTVFVNDRLAALIGYSAEEMIGRSVFDFMDEESASIARTNFRRRRTVTSSHLYELRYRRKDGSAVWTEMNVQPIHDRNGVFSGTVALLVDAAEQRRARLEVARGDQQDRALAEVMPHMVWTAHADGSVAYVNRALYEYSGILPAAMLTIGWATIVHPDDAERFGVAWKEAAGRSAIFEAELRLRRAADGMYRWHVLRATPVFGPEGDVTGWIGSCADVHDFKVATETRSILDTIGHIISIRGEDGLFEYISPNWAEYVGPENTGGMRESFHPDDVSWFDHAEHKSSAVERAIRQGEIRLRAADGEFRWFLCRTVDLPGAPKRTILTFTDINDLKRAQAAVVGSETRYRALTDAMPQMVWILTGDLDLEYVNERWSLFVGDRFRVGMRVDLAEIFHPDDLVRAQTTYAARHASNEFESEVRMRRHDDTFHWHLIRRVLLRDRDDGVERWIATGTNIEARKAAEAELEYRANHDPLTELPTRSVLMDRLTHALATARRTSTEILVIYLDIDHFKSINDTLGHRAGDRLLIEIAARIRSVLRAGDTASRFGGDEFVLICDVANAALDTEAIAERLQVAIRAPLKLDGKDIVVASSIGISQFPADGSDAAELIHKADAAMYEAKTSGRNAYRSYTPDTRRPTTPPLEFEVELRDAIERGELVVYYQPIMGLQSGCPVGAEALVRWQHPIRGILPPGEFISFAEEHGLVSAIGEHVLWAACAQLAALDLDPANPFSIAVNISAHQFARPGFVSSIAAVLGAFQIEPQHLEIEITESVVMYGTATAIATLRELEALGVKLSIDDFGTGYSSLAYIKNFPLHTLKIDRSFVIDIAENLTDQAIAKTIITLAHSLNMRVIAEGVETPEQLEQLRTFGADCFQGYLVSRPVPAEEFVRLLRTFDDPRFAPPVAAPPPRAGGAR